MWAYRMPRLFARKTTRFTPITRPGQLDMTAYLDFVLEPLTGMARSAVRSLQRQFVSECIEPMLLDKAFDLLNEHRIKGDTLLMMTATHAVVAEPVAARLGFEHWLGSGVGLHDDRYTGKAEGRPCFQQGKVDHLADWRSRHPDIADTRWLLVLLRLTQRSAAAECGGASRRRGPRRHSSRPRRGQSLANHVSALTPAPGDEIMVMQAAATPVIFIHPI